MPRDTGGAPLPVALVDPAKHASIRFDAWNRPVQIDPPADAVDVASPAYE